MNFAIYLSGLRARFRVFIAIVLVTVLAALLVSMLMQKTYVAETSIISDLKNEQTINPGTQYFNERERAGYLQTQVDILTSPRVARRVAQDLGLNGDPELKKAYEEAKPLSPFDEWMGLSLLAGLTVDTTQSSIIKVSYTSNDPVQASRYANAFAHAYIDSVLELRVAPLRQASAWFDQQAKELRANLEAVEQRLTEFQRQHSILAVDERNDLENIRLTELATQAARTSEPSTEHYVAAVVRDSRSIETLKNTLAVATARLHELTGVYGDRHPSVIRQTAEVSALSEQLDKEIKAASAHAHRAQQAARQRSLNLQADVAATRQRVGDLREAHTRLGILRADLANAQRAYDQAMQRAITSSIDSRAVVPNVSVLSEATPPSDPKTPKPGLNLVLALLVGTLLGLTAVYFLETSDRRLRLIDDLAGNPMVPLLAVLNANDPGPIRLLPDRSNEGGPAYQRAIPGPR